jgi:hypothetical protein
MMAQIGVAAILAAMGGAHRATAMGFVSAFSRLPVHPANTKANNRAMILIRAIPFCQVSKQGRRREGNAIIGIGGWKHDPRAPPVIVQCVLLEEIAQTANPLAPVTSSGCRRSQRYSHLRDRRRPAICIAFHICGQSRGSGRDSVASAAHRVDCTLREKSHPDRQAP